jgi:predicted dehydrogenase
MKNGRIFVDDVPIPPVGGGQVRVHVIASCISSGTELARLESSENLILEQVRSKRWALADQILTTLRSRGLQGLRRIIEEKLTFASPVGYSVAGVVDAVGPGVTEFLPGDSVACVGPGYANHAEVVTLPKNLVIPVPRGLTFHVASTVAVGGIALQGVRQLEPQFGERVGVIGLGILGQIAAQILRASGCRVVGLDMDVARLELAKSLGLHDGFSVDTPRLEETVMRLTEGHGLDKVLVTAASPSSDPLRLAIRLCRLKGRVAVIGEVGTDLDRGEMYRKEIELRMSMSYGPGRYDPQYEEQGIDYPFAYVRWTQRRNLEAYLQALADGRVNVSSLVSKEFPIEEADEAYRYLRDTRPRPIMVLLTYPSRSSLTEGPAMQIIAPSPKQSGAISVAVVGAGAFAREVLLPNLAGLKGRYLIHAVVSRTPAQAKMVARQYHARYATTDYEQALQDPNVDAVVIATRHHLHAPMAILALQAGKAVFLEKPLAINAEQLDQLEKMLQERPAPLLVGFNRRFSPLAVASRELLAGATGPWMIHYRVNTGYCMPHWIFSEEGGGRIIGEACHMLDFFDSFIGQPVEESTLRTLGTKNASGRPEDNFACTLRYADGSLCTLTYTSLGPSQKNREYIEIFRGGRLCVINDFFRLDVHGHRWKGSRSWKQQKGYREELMAFHDYLHAPNKAPISLASMIQTTALSFYLAEQART